MKTSYLKVYKELMSGEAVMPFGLCHYLQPYDDFLQLFEPSGDEYAWEYHPYWGSGHHQYERLGQFTPLRQTILLFIAAMNNEL